MRWYDVVRQRWNALFRRAEREHELREEMLLHVDYETEQLMRTGGLSAAEARRQARAAFGSADRYTEDVRDERGTRALEDFIRDVSLALRGVRRSPGFALVVVLTLALGIGSTAAIFTVVRGVLLRPLPYAQPEQLVRLWSRFLPSSGLDFPQFWISAPEYFDYRNGSESLSHVAALSTIGVTLTGANAEPQRVSGAQVSGDFFATLGVHAALGRVLTPADDPPGGTMRVVLGHTLWRDRFGADSLILGRTMAIDGASFEVIGIMPEGFAFPTENTVLWGPLGLDPADPGHRASHSLEMIGRLAPGATLVRAQAELQTMMRAWEAEYPDTHTGHFLYMNSLSDDVVGSVRGTLWVLLGAAGFVLLIACVNVANLMLARNDARRQELAVRATLGAGRRRLVQQMLTDSAVLALAGGVLGTLLGAVGVRALLRLAADTIPRAESVALDAGVLLFAFAVTLLSALLFGIVPALRNGGLAPGEALGRVQRGGSGGVPERRLRSALIVAEVALAVVLVSGAGLMIRSFETLTREDPGFRSESVLTAQITLPRSEYEDNAAVTAFHRELSTRLAGLPGVLAVSGASDLPLHEAPPNVDFEIEAAPPPPEGAPLRSADLVFALPEYTTALRIPMVEGRFFRAGDDAQAPHVAVVNRTAVRMFWEGQSPIGARIRTSGSDGPWHTVVGIIDDVKWEKLESEPRPAYYMPVAQAAWRPSTIHYMLRVAGDPLGVAPALRRTVRALDDRLPIIRLTAFDDVVRESVARPRFVTTLLTVFGGVALALGMIGIYGLLDYTVQRRRRELGIRMALGAGRAATARLVLRQGMQLAGIGLVVGLAGALLTARFLESMLYGVTPTDALTMTLVCAVLLAAAMLACWLPARRAVRVEPLSALRTE